MSNLKNFKPNVIMNKENKHKRHNLTFKAIHLFYSASLNKSNQSLTMSIIDSK